MKDDFGRDVAGWLLAFSVIDRVVLGQRTGPKVG